MANKRQLKKRIHAVCGELASEIMIAAHFFDSVDYNQACQIVGQIAALQTDSLAKVSFSFDKAVKDFDNKAAYNRARAQYEAKAFAKLNAEFSEKVLEIVKAMNAIVPPKVRESISK